jgi:hypothetical protein
LALAACNGIAESIDDGVCFYPVVIGDKGYEVGPRVFLKVKEILAFCHGQATQQNRRGTSNSRATARLAV